MEQARRRHLPHDDRPVRRGHAVGRGGGPLKARESPYQGLDPFLEEDADFFVGRERDTQKIVANLFARPLTLLYGPSGVGKTSLLHAGVVPALRERKHVLVASIRTWEPEGDAGMDVRGAIVEAVRRVDDNPALADVGPLPQAIRMLGRRLQRRIMVVLDQFEEYLLYHVHGDPFDAELARAVTDPELPGGFLISIREDQLARLDRYERLVPNLFDNYVRVRRLPRDEARRAIVEPLRAFKGRHMSIEDRAVEAVLDGLAPARVEIAARGLGVVPGDADDAGVKAPYLQLVLDRFWREEVRRNATKLRRRTLADLGGAETIVRTYLDETLAALDDEDQDVAARMFPYLVTPSGSKIALSVRDLADPHWAGIPEERLEPVLGKLVETRVLQPVSGRADATGPRYEIYHDVLADALLDWRRRHQERRDRESLEAKVGAEATFADLTLTRFARAQDIRERGAASAELEARYRADLASFQSRHGPIGEVFWSESTPSAVALTRRPPSFLQRLVRRETPATFHRAVDVKPGVAPRLFEILDACDDLAARANQLLRGPVQRILVEVVFAVAARALSVLDRPTAARRADLQMLRRDLETTEARFAKAARYSIASVFAAGAVAGSLYGMVGAVALEAFVGDTGDQDTRAFTFSAIAMIGAVLVALTLFRVDRRLLDPDDGRQVARRLGVLGALVATLVAGALATRGDIGSTGAGFVAAFLIGCLTPVMLALGVRALRRLGRAVADRGAPRF